MSNGFPATSPWAALSCGQSAVLAAAPKHRRECVRHMENSGIGRLGRMFGDNRHASHGWFEQAGTNLQVLWVREEAFFRHSVGKA